MGLAHLYVFAALVEGRVLIAAGVLAGVLALRLPSRVVDGIPVARPGWGVLKFAALAGLLLVGGLALTHGVGIDEVLVPWALTLCLLEIAYPGLDGPGRPPQAVSSV